MNYSIVLFLLLLFACESKKISTIAYSNKIVDYPGYTFLKASKSITYEQMVNSLSDTIKQKLGNKFYNRDYDLTVYKFTKDKQEAIRLLKTQKVFSPSHHQVYQIILTLDDKKVINKIITPYTFKDSLQTFPLDKYYIDDLKYTGVRTKTLYFRTSLRLKDEPTEYISNGRENISVSFIFDYLEDIGKFTYVAQPWEFQKNPLVVEFPYQKINMIFQATNKK